MARYRTSSTAIAPADRVVALASSAGGLQAIRLIIEVLPADLPAAVIVLQHSSIQRPESLAYLLQGWSAMPVYIAEDGDRLLAGRVYIIPGGTQAEVEQVEMDRCLRLRGIGRINGVWPCADVLFDSLAKLFKDRAIGVVLSGMGRDGAMGTRSIRQAGGFVLVQRMAETAERFTPECCQHSGMPHAACEFGQVDLALPPRDIAQAIQMLLRDQQLAPVG